MKGPSNYGMSLLRNEVVNIDMRPNTYTETFRILANDDLNIKFDFHAVIAIESGSVKTVVEQYGAENWYKRFVRETLERMCAIQYKNTIVASLKQIVRKLRRK